MQTDNTPLKIKHDSLFKGSANPFLSDSQTIKAHRTNVDFATEVLRNAGIICDVIPAKKAAQWILIRTNSDVHKYTPLKFIDDKRVGQSSVGSWLVNPVTGDIDVSAFMAPPLSEQLARQSVIEERFQDGILRQGNRFYATHTVDVMPKQQISFNRLKKVLKKIPFRMTFLLKPKPTNLLAKVNESINRYFGGVSEMNKEYYRQIKLIGAMQEEFDYPPINLQILIVTWGDSVQDVMRLSHQINQSIVDWGGARMDYDNISPFQTFFSSIPGVNMISHSDGCLIGADKLVKLLPHQIESSLNEYGPLIFRHESGKICAYNPNNRYQDYDYTIFLARPRQGKSLLMNAKLIVSIMMEGAAHFPLMTSMDIGPSSEGALQLLRLMLQDKHGKEQAKRMVVSQKWDPENGRWKANPLDIRLGRTTPTNQEKMFIQNFYASVCAESETGIPVEGGVDVIVALIDKIYLELQEPHKCKRFNPAIAPRLTTLAAKYSIKTTVPNLINEQEVEYKSYFELRDEFFIAGSMEGASLSHRLAMTTVDSLTELLSTDTAINKRFEKIYPGVIDKIRHKLQTHRSSMPHLANYTTLDFSDAHIISFDLKP
ncbi:MAG: hypothetical protein GW890_06180, partial [Vibrio sp.]|nr:hypothetical protein [Vibrio sp.]